MYATRRTSSLRRVAMMAALAALAIPAGPAEAAKKSQVKPPVITSVSPMKVRAGAWLTIEGRNFRRGKGRNSVGFKRDGAAVVFARSDISTAKMMKVRVPVKLEDLLYSEGAEKVPTRFRLRILTSRFGARYTAAKRSPLVSARLAAPGDGGTQAPPIGLEPNKEPTPPPAQAPEADCDGDTLANGVDGDDDNDFLADALENDIGTDGCKADTDGDGVLDGYEYRSAIDLNDDEYENPNTALPYPGKRPYPNPLDKEDVKRDHDGDGLSLADEYALWRFATPNPAGNPFAPVAGKATPLSYSAGLQYSVSVYDGGRRVPALSSTGYAKWQAFWDWAVANRRSTVQIHTTSFWYDHVNGREPFDIRDADLSHGPLSARELVTLDRHPDGYLSDDERDEDADGLSNLDELRARATPEYWAGCYSKEAPELIPFEGTNLVDPDSDGDGVLDGADDQDFDDYPNLMELSRRAASGYQPLIDERDDGVKNTVTGGGQDCVADPDLKDDEPRHSTAYGQVNPFNRCLPDPNARNCPLNVPFGTKMPGTGPDWWALQ